MQPEDYLVPAENGCLEWARSRLPTGYGRLRYEGKTQYAHRVIYERAKGPIPPGELLRHTCDNPPCCNVQHLVPGTHKDNAEDRDSRGRSGTITHGKYVGGVKRVYVDREAWRQANRKLSDDQVREIRRLHTGGLGPSEIGRMFDMNETSIRRIVRFVFYQDVV